MTNPRLKPRKTSRVERWLTRDYDGNVVRWSHLQERDTLQVEADGRWRDRHWNRLFANQEWTEKQFKALYTGIPRRGRAVYVQMEIVVE